MSNTFSRPLTDMTLFSLILTPKDPVLCIQLFRQHLDTLCEKCGIEKTFKVNKPLQLTMAVLDIDYGAFVRRPSSEDVINETPPFVINNRYKFTLKIKTQIDNQEVIVCHLHEGNKYQSIIDIRLSAESTVVFSCQQTCSIHLTGYYLN